MGSTAAAIVPNPGEVVTYRFPFGSSACDLWITITGLVRAVGQHYILVEDMSNPVVLSTGDLSRWTAILDQQVIPVVQQWFGTPTDFDGNNRIVVLITRQLNLQRPGTIGLVRSFDIRFSRVSCPSSNDGEVFYMWAVDPNGSAGPLPVPHSVFAANLLSTWGHEIVHIIQFAELFRQYGPFFVNPAHWIVEGGATLSEEIVGWSIEGRSRNQNLGATVALGAGVEGTEWFKMQWQDLQSYFGLESNTSRVPFAPESCVWTLNPPGSFSTCLGRGLYYGVAANLQRWVLDHVNVVPMGFTKSLFLNPGASVGNGLSALSSVTGLTLQDILPTWQMSMWADNRAALGTFAVQQPSWNLQDIFGAMSPFGRLAPWMLNWGATGSLTIPVASGSAHYTEISGAAQPSTSLLVQGPGGNPLPSSVRLWLLRTQ